MRQDSAQYAQAARAPDKRPRYVVKIEFPTESKYCTSHDDISGVPAVVLEGVLQEPSAISQRLIPDEGRSEIGAFTFSLIDKDSQFTDEIRDKLLNDFEGIRGRKVTFWEGYEGFDFSAFQVFQTQTLQYTSYANGAYTVRCADITREQRQDICEPKFTTLRDSIDADDTAVPVYVTTDFETVAHGTGWSDAPSSTVGYIKVEDEIIRYTGKTADSFTGCTRGALNTKAVAHQVDSGTAAERRTKVEEYIYLELSAVKLAWAILTGQILGNLLGTIGAFETDSNADGLSDNWASYSNAGTFSRVTGWTGSGFAQRFVSTGTSARIAHTSGTYKYVPPGQSFTVSARIKANAGLTLQINCKGHTSATGGETVQYGSGVTTAIGNWQRISATFVSSASGPYIRALPGFGGATGAGQTCDVDDVQIEFGTVATTETTAQAGLLPDHWHLGIDPSLIRFSDFTDIGKDLWDLTDDSAALPLRFEGLKKTDGKRFLEKEVYLVIGCYSPVYSDGTLGLRRLPALISDSAPVATLTEREVTSLGELMHDEQGMHNVFRVNWN